MEIRQDTPSQDSLEDLTMLSIMEILRETQWLDKDGKPSELGRAALGRYLAKDELRVILGAKRKLRPTFPAEAIQAFEALKKAHLEGAVTPTTVVSWMQDWLCEHPECDVRNVRTDRTEIAVQSDVRTNDGAAPLPSRGNEMTATMKEFIHSVKDITPVREDSLLTRHQAAALLSCSPQRVVRFVRPIRRGAFRRSDCLRYIASGIPQGMGGMETQGEICPVRRQPSEASHPIYHTPTSAEPEAGKITDTVFELKAIAHYLTSDGEITLKKQRQLFAIYDQGGKHSQAEEDWIMTVLQRTGSSGSQ